MSTSPGIFGSIKGKIDPAAEKIIDLLGKGLKDAHDAIAALKGQHDALAAQVTGVSKTAATASTQAAAANSQLAQPVPAGTTNIQTADYAVQQQDHLGMVTLQGTSALNITLNNLVAAPYVTHIINQSSQTATLAPSNPEATVNNAASVPLNAGADVHVYYDGLNWIAA